MREDMSEADDKRDLSGLARSIDALFSGPPRGNAPAQEVEPLEPVAPLPEPEPWSGPWSEPEPTTALAESWPEPFEPEPIPLLPEPEPEPSLAEAWPEPEEALGSSMAVDASQAPSAADPDDLDRAVGAYLAGAPGAGAEVRTLAEDLRGRLALDPVADAVERLVREAGTPPDPTLVDMARTIIGPAVASRIVQRIGHQRDDDRKAEYVALCRQLGEIMAKAFRGALTGKTEPGATRAYYDALIAMAETSRPIIEEMVEDENALLVRSGVAILGEMGGDRAKELVTSALAHPDARVRREALLALAKLGDDESGALVVGFLEDPDREVRVAAATAAGALKVERALRPLLHLLETEGEGERAVPFLEALGNLGDPGAVPAIERHAVGSMFSKPDIEVRVAAYRALHDIGSPHARELVQKALSGHEPALRAALRRFVGSSTEG